MLEQEKMLIFIYFATLVEIKLKVFLYVSANPYCAELIINFFLILFAYSELFPKCQDLIQMVLFGFIIFNTIPMSTSRLTLLRLQKQEKKLEQQPIPNAFVSRKGLLHFHFCIYGIDAPYKDGYYHGVLQLHEEYPFSPPKLMFFTPNGRFQTNKPICTTFTNFHKQTWTSAWNVRTMITATISFMQSNELGVGGLNDSYLTKHRYASQSLRWNLKNQVFRQLFRQKLLKNKVQISQIAQDKQQHIQNEPKQSIKGSYSLYLLYFVLIILVIFWGVFKQNQIGQT